MAIIGGPQMYVGDMRVDLGGRRITKTEQCLDRTRVGPVLQQVRRKAVTQRMRRNIFNPCLLSVMLNDGPGEVARERLPTIQKNIRRRRLSITRLHRRILLQPMNRALAERHSTLFVSFPVTHDETGKEIDVVLLQPDELR